MAFHIPGEDTDLVIIIGQAILWLGHQHQILRNFFVSVGDLVQDKKGHSALAFGVLRDFKRHIQIHHPREHPTYVPLGIADEPPVFEQRALAWTLRSYARLQELANAPGTVFSAVARFRMETLDA